jgi:hypothetical protein
VCGPEVWLKLYERRFFAGLAGVPLELLKVLTLTAPGDDVLPNPGAIAAWNLRSFSYRNRFEQAVRRATGVKCAFFWTGEMQKRGAVHFHGVCRGLKFFHYREYHDLEQRSGFGTHGEIQAWRSSGSIRSSWRYMAKYLTKDVFEWPYRARPIAHSRNWVLPENAGMLPQSKRSEPGEWRYASLHEWWYDEGRALVVGELGGADAPGRPSDRVPF